MGIRTYPNYRGIPPISSERGGKPRSYRVAGRPIITDVPLVELAPFEVTGLELGFHPPLATLPTPQSQGGRVYCGPGWIGNQWREVECWWGSAGCRLAVAGAGLFAIARDGCTIAQIEADPTADSSLVIETVLGPALILALALQGTWCLHASAVVSGERVIAFVAESGTGKSVLAAFLGGEGDTCWRRIADDALPVTPGSDGLVALPHFPQLKLPPENQYPLGEPERMPLEAVYLLTEPEDGKGVEIHPLSRREAMLALVRHTIAARLFDKDLLARHMTFCAEAAARVPVRRLVYPHNYALLPRVRDAIAADLESLHLNRT